MLSIRQVLVSAVLFVATSPLLAQETPEQTCNFIPMTYIASANYSKINLDDCDESRSEVILAVPKDQNLKLSFLSMHKPEASFDIVLENHYDELVVYAVADGKLIEKTRAKTAVLNSIERENKRRSRMIVQHSQQFNLMRFDLKKMTISPIIQQSLLIDRTRANPEGQTIRYLEARPASLGVEVSLNDNLGSRAKLTTSVGPGFFAQKVLGSEDRNELNLKPTPGVNVKLVILLGED